jgi:hypothetical protein
MRRRSTLLLLVAVFLLPLTEPVSAAEPQSDPSPAATSEPSAEVPTGEPTSDPSGEPARTEEPAQTEAPTEEPTPAAAAPASPDPSAEPTRGRGKALPDDSRGRPDPTGRYIVFLQSGADTAAVAERHRRRDGVTADRQFDRAIRGFSARLDARQRLTLLADPTVLAVVPDEVIELTAQTLPTGVARIGANKSPVASINGFDHRVDADVAIVDTGIQPNHPDLNVVGGYNCATTNRSLWRDVQGHGTHVAGTVGALDNTIGAVGVAPGVRLWAVRILNDEGFGLLSWYVCGLDWILAQKDPLDPSRPLFEAVNMSVAKDGADDKNCGMTSKDVLHQAVCRVVASGVTVVAAAANESQNANRRVPAAYSQTLTVSALADTDGKPGGLGGNRCYSWGGYDKDDTFADFSNYGKVVDLIAPGKCIWSTKPGSTYGYSSGTSMAAPAVAGAVALYKASRPNATPAEVKEALQYLGNLDWDVSTDPDAYHEKLVDVSKIGPLGTFSLSAPDPEPIPEIGGTRLIPVTLGRSATFFERTSLSLSGVPTGWKASIDATSLMGWTATATTLRVTAPKATPAGRYDIRVIGTNQGRSISTVVTVTVEVDEPTVGPPVARPAVGAAASATSVPFTVLWPAATDPTSPIAGYELQMSRDGGPWGSTVATAASVLKTGRTLVVGSTYRFRVRARDAVGVWSPWAESATTYRPTIVNDRNSAVIRAGTWSRVTSASAIFQNLSSTTANGASASLTFTGKGIGVVAPRSMSRGWLTVHVDGVLVKTVSLRATTLQHRRTVYAREWATSATHTIKVVFVRSGSRTLGSIDGFVVVK